MKEIIFANNPLDRMSSIRGDQEWQRQSKLAGNSIFLVFKTGKPLIKVSSDTSIKSQIRYFSSDQVKGHLDSQLVIFLGQYSDHNYFAINLENDLSPDLYKNDSKFIDLRSIAQNLSAEDTGILAQAKSIIDWNLNHKYCSKCSSSKLEIKDTGYKKYCLECKTEFFPRVDPVVIMLPTFEDKCLLGRQKIFPPRMYSALAGFLEPGETIEDAVIREVKEESGLDVTNVQYKFTQPWPFPYQLMIGCFAEAKGDVLNIDKDEIEDAIWLTKEDLNRIFVGKHPNRIWIPPAMAVAHQLIVSWMHA